MQVITNTANKPPKKRNMIALTMQSRHKNGGAAGYHSNKGYSRKKKHKAKREW